MSTQARAFRVIGKRIPKVDGVDKVTGRSQFGADVKVPGALFGKVLRSPHAHARIVRIDTSAASALPGVMAVITGKDLPVPSPEGEGPGGTASVRHSFLSDEIIATDTVLFHGHPVAAVAARSRGVAEEALNLIEVEYEVLPHVLDPVEAMKPDAPVLHENLHTRAGAGYDAEPSNIGEHLEMGRGDVEAGFASADTVLERSFRTQIVHQGYIEPEAETALVRPDGSVVVWANTQGTYAQRQELAAILRIPESKIQVIPTEVGGGFGGKVSVRVSALCVALSRRAGLPVHIALSREEVLRATGPGNALVATIKVGALRDGTIIAIQAHLVYDVGSYPGGLLSAPVRRVFSQYRTPNLRIDAFGVVTNKPHLTAYRAPGGTPTAFCLESVVDELGESLGLGPLDFRLKNVSQPGDLMPDGAELPSINLTELLELVRDHPCWTTPLPGPNQGRGLAVGMWTVPGGTASCHITLSGDGSVTLVLGTVDLSATRTSLGMVAAESLDLEMADVRVVQGDTDMASYSDPSSADKITYVASKAVQKASDDLLARLKERVAEEFDVSPEDVNYEAKRFWVEGAPEMGADLADLARRAVKGEGGVMGYARASDPAGVVAIAPNAAAHVVDVEVDPETGSVRVLRYTAFQDVGLNINPDSVEGQMQGGVTQGIGWALSEAYDYDEQGVLLNASLLDYRISTSMDVPYIAAEVAEYPSPDHPLGVRAAGQVPIVPPAGAIASAIYRAVGVRLRELPMKPERVYRALAEADSTG